MDRKTSGASTRCFGPRVHGLTCAFMPPAAKPTDGARKIGSVTVLQFRAFSSHLKGVSVVLAVGLTAHAAASVPARSLRVDPDRRTRADQPAARFAPGSLVHRSSRSPHRPNPGPPTRPAGRRHGRGSRRWGTGPPGRRPGTRNTPGATRATGGQARPATVVPAPRLHPDPDPDGSARPGNPAGTGRRDRDGLVVTVEERHVTPEQAPRLAADQLAAIMEILQWAHNRRRRTNPPQHPPR